MRPPATPHEKVQSSCHFSAIAIKIALLVVKQFRFNKQAGLLLITVVH